MIETVSHSFGSLLLAHIVGWICRCSLRFGWVFVQMGEYFYHPKVLRLRCLHLQVDISNWAIVSFKDCVTLSYFAVSVLRKELWHWKHTQPVPSASDWNKRQTCYSTYSGKLTLAQIGSSLEVRFLVWVKNHTSSSNYYCYFGWIFCVGRRGSMNLVLSVCDWYTSYISEQGNSLLFLPRGCEQN